MFQLVNQNPNLGSDPCHDLGLYHHDNYPRSDHTITLGK